MGRESRARRAMTGQGNGTERPRKVNLNQKKIIGYYNWLVEVVRAMRVLPSPEFIQAFGLFYVSQMKHHFEYKLEEMAPMIPQLWTLDDATTKHEEVEEIQPSENMRGSVGAVGEPRFGTPSTQKLEDAVAEPVEEEAEGDGVKPSEES